MVNKATGECPTVRCPESRRPFVRPVWCRERLKTVNNEPTMTQQSHATSVDVNHIIDRYKRSGYMPAEQRQGAYADVTGLQGDLTQRYNDALETLETARRDIDAYNARLSAEASEAAAAAATTPPATVTTPDATITQSS